MPHAGSEKMSWLKMGNIDMLEISAERYDSVTIRIGEEICLTVVLAAGEIDPDLYESLEEVKAALREEAGF